MATVNRGDSGESHESQVIVWDPPIAWDGSYLVCDDVEIVCPGEGKREWGFPVKITLSHDEALQFCAELAARLAMRVNPPRPPAPPPAKPIVLRGQSSGKRGLASVL